MHQVMNCLTFYAHIWTCSGIIGSGLCVFSRHPIISAYSHQFTAGDGIYRFKTGEIFAGKGVMAVKITTPEGVITFYNTHVRWRERERERERPTPLFTLLDQWKSLPRKSTIRDSSIR